MWLNKLGVRDCLRTQDLKLLSSGELAGHRHNMSPTSSSPGKDTLNPHTPYIESLVPAPALLRLLLWGTKLLGF